MMRGLIATIICLFLVMFLVVCLFVGGGVIISQIFGITGWIASMIAGGGFFFLCCIVALLFGSEEKDYEQALVAYFIFLKNFVIIFI